jgi:hypothetical protein
MNYNNLDDNSPKIIQPNNLSIELMQHQKTAVYALKDLEDKGYVDIKFRYYDNDEKDLRINTNIGILGDRVGSGKTLTIAALLLTSNKSKTNPIYFSSDRYTLIEEIKTDDNYLLNLNVIMVPKGIQHQWEIIFKDNIKHRDSIFFNHYDAATRDIFDNVNQLFNLKDPKSIIILCNESSMTDIIKEYGKKRWNRIIIDEADTIQFTSLINVSASFIWLVTGTTNGISYSKRKYIKEIFGSNISWLPDFLTIKNNNSYIDMSIDLPKPNRITIKCHTPNEILLLADHIPKNIMNMINAGNTDDAIKTLNCHVDTSDNIFKVISRNYEMAIENKKNELKIAKKKHTKDDDNEKNIKHIELILKRLEEKLLSIKNALYEANDELCPICMSEYETPTIVDCCAHKYCFNCLALTLEKSANKCPVCQTKITKNKMHIMSSNPKQIHKSDKNNKNHSKREKIEELYQIIKKGKISSKDPVLALCEGKTSDRRFIVFADYDQTFAKIEKVFIQYKIKYGILKGGGAKIKNTLNDFEKGNINFIILNAKNFGAGMNLHCATDIIMYHRFSDEMEEQIIGRGQRLGRKGVLNVYYLIHENESDSFKDDKFNNINYQDWLANE